MKGYEIRLKDFRQDLGPLTIYFHEYMLNQDLKCLSEIFDIVPLHKDGMPGFALSFQTKKSIPVEIIYEIRIIFERYFSDYGGQNLYELQ